MECALLDPDGALEFFLDRGGGGGGGTGGGDAELPALDRDGGGSGGCKILLAFIPDVKFDISGLETELPF